MKIRTVKPTDVGLVLTIAKELALSSYPLLRWDYDRTRATMNELVVDSRHYARVVSNEHDEPVAALLALTADNLWAQRRHSSVVLWYSSRPTAGAALLRDFKKWCEQQPAIRVAGFHPDLEIDARALRLAERIGFSRHGGAFLLY